MYSFTEVRPYCLNDWTKNFRRAFHSSPLLVAKPDNKILKIRQTYNIMKKLLSFVSGSQSLCIRSFLSFVNFNESRENYMANIKKYNCMFRYFNNITVTYCKYITCINKKKYINYTEDPKHYELSHILRWIRLDDLEGIWSDRNGTAEESEE